MNRMSNEKLGRGSVKRAGKYFLLVSFITLLLSLFAGCDTGGGGDTYYTVTFNSHGGSAVASQSVVEGGKATEPGVPAKAGYGFGDWHTSAAYGTAWDFDSDTVTGDTTLHAKWTNNDAQAALNEAALEAAGEITLTAPKAGGGTAAVGITVAGGTVAIAIDGGAATSYPATFTETAITLAGAGADGADVSLGYAINAGGTLTISSGLDAIAGAGLASGPVTSAPNAGLEQPAAGITSYAIAYTLNGGTNHASNPATYAVESAVTLNAPTKPGYDFGGWFDNSGFTGTAVTAIPSGSTGDRAFFAKWAAASYAIAYNLDGGANHASNPAAYTIESAAIALGAPTKGGYDFGGWFDNSGFTGTAATAIASGSTGDRAFWAKWAEKTYSQSVTVEFTDGGAALAASGAISFAQGGSTTITLTGAGAYASIKWVADGVEQSTGGSVTLDGIDYGVGQHTLVVVVTKAGSAAPWSKTLAFTVTE